MRLPRLRSLRLPILYYHEIGPDRDKHVMGGVSSRLSPQVQETVVAMLRYRRGQKNDALDAYVLAEKLRIGQIERQVFKAPGQFALLRELARAHSMITRDLVRVQAPLKSLYRSRGVRTSGGSVYGSGQREAPLIPLNQALYSEVQDPPPALVVDCLRSSLSRPPGTRPRRGSTRAKPGSSRRMCTLELNG